jgi:hypothetical protein
MLGRIILITSACAAAAGAQVPGAPVLQNAFANPGWAVAANLAGGSGQSFYGLATAMGLMTGQLQLSLIDSLQGCLRLQLDLAAADLDTLAVGPRYFYAPDPSLSSTSSATQFFLYSQGYRLFAGKPCPARPTAATGKTAGTLTKNTDTPR